MKNMKFKKMLYAPKTVYREIYDISGRLMDYDKIEISSGETIERIDISKFAKGIYFMKEIQEDSKEKPQTYKMVK